MRTFLFVLLCLCPRFAWSVSASLADMIPPSGTIAVSGIPAALLVEGLPRLLLKSRVFCDEMAMNIEDVKTKKRYRVCLEVRPVR